MSDCTDDCTAQAYTSLQRELSTARAERNRLEGELVEARRDAGVFTVAAGMWEARFNEADQSVRDAAWMLEKWGQFYLDRSKSPPVFMSRAFVAAGRPGREGSRPRGCGDVLRSVGEALAKGVDWHAAPNDREAIADAISREANRIWQTQEPDYPSNVLDTVGWNIRAGLSDLLTERKHPSGKGLDPAPTPEPIPGTQQTKGQP
jgi:hypothetical protein